MEIANIVVSGSFNQKVDLQALMSLGDIYSYNTDLYHGGYIKLSSAKVTIYQSGKYIIPEIKSISLIDKLWEELISILFAHMDVMLSNQVHFCWTAFSYDFHKRGRLFIL